MVIEDTWKGLQAARAAGMAVVDAIDHDGAIIGYASMDADRIRAEREADSDMVSPATVEELRDDGSFETAEHDADDLRHYLALVGLTELTNDGFNDPAEEELARRNMTVHALPKAGATAEVRAAIQPAGSGDASGAGE